VKGPLNRLWSSITASPGRRVVIARRDRGSANFGRHQPIVEIDMIEKTVTCSASELKAVLDAAIAEALAARDAKPVPANKLVDGKTEASLKMDILVVKAFKRAGFGEVQPRVDTKTYQKWLSEGYRVKPGEKAVRVKQFRLFAKSQCEYVGLQPKETPPSEAEVTAVKEAKAATAPTIMQRLKGKASAQTSLPV
jgi:hypothetical protein